MCEPKQKSTLLEFLGCFHLLPFLSFMNIKTRKCSGFKTEREKYHVSCNVQLIQSQNWNFLLAKVLEFQMPPSLGSGCLREGRAKLVSFVKDQEEPGSSLLQKTAPPAAGCWCRRHTCLSDCPASQPSNSRLLGERGQFHLFPSLLFKGDFL